MGLTSQLPNIHHHLIAFFRQFMSQPPPTDVHGLFISHPGFVLDTCGWHQMLRDSANSCRLERMEFCKRKNGKLHEFLILYFSHHTHASARAVVIVDRAAKDPSRSSAIVAPSLPSQKTTPALDTVHVVGQNVNFDAYLSNTFGEYDTLCILEYPKSFIPQPPSAIQLSILLLVVTKHQPDYNLYEHNCYWFADMVFEASKELFPGYRESCYKHDDRGRCRLNLTMLATHNLRNICKEYSIEWGKACEEERRGREEERRGREEERRGREEERRGREEERRAREELERKHWQLQAELQTVRQAPPHVAMN
ncbi:hypothetical protein HD554DRAFT_2011044 [Boletus coccyginus]|nr:hypothetical protein HD554DRAFT_2011044 [Boletus coccyginus]